MCVEGGYLGSLPWLSTMVAFPWSAYGVSQAFYYNKSKAENTTGGVVFEQAMSDCGVGVEIPISASTEEPTI